MDAERIIERNTAEEVVDEAAAVAVEDVDEAETAALEEVEEEQEEVVEALR